MKRSCIPLSIYIHFPWCVRKCPYCDFNSYPLTAATNRDLYIAALIRDLQQDLPKIKDRKITSIYLGGGTPSLFVAQQIEKILNAIARHLPLAHSLEITMEINPGTVTEEECCNLRTLGINRLSVGVQSFQNVNLAALGRIYRRAQVVDTLSFVAEHFSNFNLDLLFGLPKQTVRSALNDLQLATSFSPTHLSWYQLTIEDGSQFYVQPPTLPSAERIWRIQEEGRNFLKWKKFRQYEVSAYSKKNAQCQHNLNYWLFGDYLGIGAGAHSKLTLGDKIIRFNKFSQPQEYLANPENFVAVSATLTARQLLEEFMLNALRLYRPIPLALFQARTGLHREILADCLKRAQALGLLQVHRHALVVTERGHNFLNDLLEVFF